MDGEEIGTGELNLPNASGNPANPSCSEADMSHLSILSFPVFNWIGDGPSGGGCHAHTNCHSASAGGGTGMTATTLDIEKGLAAAKRGDYAAALRELRPLADQGNARAQYFLGVLYFEGNGVTQDVAKAAEWFRKAAEQGDVNAQPSLGAMYARGLGVPQDDTKAVKWYRKAAEQGFAESQVNLGLAYYNGQGVPQDHGKAYMWFSLAAENGDREGAKGRDLLAKSMTSDQIATAQNLAREWQEKRKMN